MRRCLPHLLCLTFPLLISCSAQKQRLSIELPSTPMLTSESLWGIANRPYLKILESPDSNGVPREVLRHGDIVRIVSKVTAGRDYWFEIQVPATNITGWTLDENINVYDSSAQAHTAQAEILVSEFSASPP